MAIKGTYPGQVITVEAAASAIPKHRCINFASGLAADDNAGILGVSGGYDVLSGEHFDVTIGGIVKVEASGSGSAGGALIGAASGMVKAQDGSVHVVGWALDDFADGDYVRVKLA